MTGQSRSVLPYACNQVLHPWHNDCIPAAVMLAKPCMRESFKIYCVFYGVTGLMKLHKIKTLKDLRRFLTRFVTDVIRSTIFLGMHGVLFMPVCCTGRQVFGHISYYKLYFQIIFSTLPCILVERKQRRGALALYMANIAIEVLFKMAVHRKMITPLFNGEIIIFSIASAIYTYLLKRTSEHKHNAFLFSAVKWLIGDQECAPPLTTEQKPESKKKLAIFALFYRYLARVKRWDFIQNRNHAVCKHEYHCLIHILRGFLKRFSIGVLVQLGMHFIRSPIQFLKHPFLFFRTLNRNTLNLGFFLGLYCGIYRSISCLLRNILKKDRPAHGLLAGYFAGFSMLYFKSSTVAMYMMAKLVESIYFKYAHEKKVPLFPWFDSVLYAISTALVFHAAVIEPHAIRPAYYKFLERLADRHFGEVNRPMMESFGVDSAKLFPNYKLPSIH